jgi:hypothetical protein
MIAIPPHTLLRITPRNAFRVLSIPHVLRELDFLQSGLSRKGWFDICHRDYERIVVLELGVEDEGMVVD